MSLNDKPRPLVGKAEEDQIARNVLKWINMYPNFPDNLPEINPVKYSTLAAKAESMALATVPGTFIIDRDILGNYEAEYQFVVAYRIYPGLSAGKKLEADELLNAIGDWASSLDNPGPDLGARVSVSSVETVARASIQAAYEDGYEDHQITMLLTYSVSV